MLCPFVFVVVKPPVDTAAVSSKTLVLQFGSSLSVVSFVFVDFVFNCGLYS